MRTFISILSALVGVTISVGWAWMPDRLIYATKPPSPVFTNLMYIWSYIGYTAMLICVISAFYKAGGQLYDEIRHVYGGNPNADDNEYMP